MKIMDSVQMTKSESVPAAPALRSGPLPMPMSCCAPFSRVQLPPGALRSWIGNRYVLAVVGLALVGSGLALGWGWLTAIGIAPVIVAVAPCLVMCAVCLGMMCRHGQGGAAPSAPPTDAPPPSNP
jgi:hypothetical protein